MPEGKYHVVTAIGRLVEDLPATVSDLRSTLERLEANVSDFMRVDRMFRPVGGVEIWTCPDAIVAMQAMQKRV